MHLRPRACSILVPRCPVESSHCSTSTALLHTSPSVIPIGNMTKRAESKYLQCNACGGHFVNDNELAMHSTKHKPRDLECWGCYKKFKSIAHVFLHLESGSCPSDWTRKSVQAEATKLRGPWRNLEPGSEFYIVCPGCERSFAIVSGFLQHIESASCDEGFFSGQRSVIGLLRQLRRNMRFDRQDVLGIAI